MLTTLHKQLSIKIIVIFCAMCLICIKARAQQKVLRLNPKNTVSPSPQGPLNYNEPIGTVQGCIWNVFPRFLIWNHSQVMEITTDADLNYFYLDASEFVNVDEFAESVKRNIVKIIDEENKFYVFISNGKSPIISESKDDYEKKIINRLYSLRTPYPSLENDYQFLKTKIGNDIILQKESSLVNVHLYISKKFCNNSLMNLIKKNFRSKLNAEGKNERITQAVNLILHIEQENEDGLYALSKCEYVVPSIIEDLEVELDCNCKN